MMNLFDNEKIYGGEYVMEPGYPRDFNAAELAFCADEAEITQGMYHKGVKLYLRNEPHKFIQFDLSRECEGPAVVGAKVKVTSLRIAFMRKPGEEKIVKRIILK